MRGATSSSLSKELIDLVSIHAPMRGATSIIVFVYPRSHSFNPRAHAGRDHDTPKRKSKGNRFNPRAHAGRDINHYFTQM